MKSSILGNDAKNALLLVACLTFALVLFMFVGKIGIPVQLIVFCVTFYLFIEEGRRILFNYRYGETAAAVLAFFLSILWIVKPSWITQDITSLCMAGAILPQMKWISLRRAVVVAAAVIVYDVIMVFGTGFMQATVLQNGVAETPLVFTIPPAVAAVIGIQFIGLGDIILPGMLAVAGSQEGKRQGCRFALIGAVAGYGIGALFTILIHSLFHFPQPATLYLYPGVFLGLWSAFALSGVSFLSAIRGK